MHSNSATTAPLGSNETSGHSATRPTNVFAMHSSRMSAVPCTYVLTNAAQQPSHLTCPPRKPCLYMVTPRREVYISRTAPVAPPKQRSKHCTSSSYKVKYSLRSYSTFTMANDLNNAELSTRLESPQSSEFVEKTTSQQSSRVQKWRGMVVTILLTSIINGESPKIAAPSLKLH